MKHRTTAQIAELCLQSAEDYHQQYLYKVPNGYCPDHSRAWAAPSAWISADRRCARRVPAAVDDVDAACAELAQLGVPLIDGPVDRPWGIRTASFTDPAGAAP
jgi:catechol 2,3-dioxygenase-like lactoylglutathione lyase family enzyme